MIKGQTLHDYHNHVIHIINQMIDAENKIYGANRKFEENEHERRIKDLNTIKENIIYDWKYGNHNYSKVKQ